MNAAPASSPPPSGQPETPIDLSWRRYLLPPLHEEGPRFVVAFVAVSALLGWLWGPLGIVGMVLSVWCVAFFRDPPRAVPLRPGLVVSPASGVVQRIDAAAPPPELEMGDACLTRISIFMSVFDCHVNRIPAAGVVAKQSYRPGLFLNASLDKASEKNERNAVRLTLDDGRSLAVVQIAGLVARRIRSDLVEGQAVGVGQKFGLIRFGSCLEVYLPPEAAPQVVLGQICVSGETVLADLSSNEAARQGAIVR